MDAQSVKVAHRFSSWVWLAADGMSSQTIWSRSRPRVSNFYRRCRCYTCLAHPDHALLLRRPTPATKVGQWRKLTTLFYSSLFATAAAADAHVKRSRRDHWDALIATAEEEVQQGRVREKDRERRHPTSDLEPPESLNVERNSELPRRLSDLLKRFGASEVPIPYGLQGRDPGPNSIYASEYMSSKESKWTPKKLAIMELAMAKLALGLSMAIPNVDQRESMVDGQNLKLKPMLAAIVHKLRVVESGGVFNPDPEARAGLPQYVPSERTGSPNVRNIPLDATLWRLVKDYDKGWLDLARFLTGISQNILAARQPPEVSSMTIILNSLSRNKHFDLADAVYESITDAKIRPDEMSADTTIRYLIAANNEDGFNHFKVE